MNRYPAKIDKRPPRKVEETSVEVLPSNALVNPFLSFSYSYTEISTLDGKARLKSRKVRYESGKLTEKAFEGEVDRTIYRHMVDDAQRYFQAQAVLLFETFSSLLPLSRNRSGRD